MSKQKVKKKEQKIKEFADLLESLTDTEDKKKLLWKDAYQNAVDDRETAGALLTELVLQSHGNQAIHAQFGSLMTKYLERMNKSNDQILKLAELIAKEQENIETISDDDIFDKITGKG